MKSLGLPNLLDLLVQPASEDVNTEDVEDLRPSKRRVLYPEVAIETYSLSESLVFLITVFHEGLSLCKVY